MGNLLKKDKDKNKCIYDCEICKSFIKRLLHKKEDDIELKKHLEFLIGYEIYSDNWTIRYNDSNQKLYYLTSIYIPLYQIGTELDLKSKKEQLNYYIPTFIMNSDFPDSKIVDIIFSNVKMKILKKGDDSFDNSENEDFKYILF
jgi:hypothetical protein